MKNKIIKIKQSIEWNFVFYLLQTLYGFPEIMNDKYFFNKFEELFNYTSNKIAPLCDGEVKDIYAVVEQEINE